MYMNNFGGLPQYGQQQQGMGQQMPGQMQPMGGPQGFAGQMGQQPGQQMTPPIMQGMPGQQQGQMPQMPGHDPADPHKHHGLNPAFLMGLLPGLLAGGGGLSSIAPMFGLAGMFGRKLFK